MTEVIEMIEDKDVIDGVGRLSSDLQKEYMRIGEMITRRKIDEAEEAVKEVLDHYDDSVNGLFRTLLGDILLYRGDVHSAENLYRDMIKDPCARNNGYFGLAQILWHDADPETAKEYLDRIRDPQKNLLVDVFGLYAEIYFAMDEGEEAERKFDEAVNKISTSKSRDDAKQFLMLQLYSRAVSAASHAYDEHYVRDWLSEFGAYLSKNHPINGNELALIQILSDLLPEMIEDPDCRAGLRDFTDGAEQGGWLNDKNNSAEDMRALLDNEEYGEDIDGDEITHRYFASILSDEDTPKEKEMYRWMAARRYLEHPEYLETLEEYYPSLYEIGRKEADQLRADPKKEMEYAEQAYMEDSGITDRDRARRFLNRMYDSYDFNDARILDVDLDSYPPHVKKDVFLAVQEDFYRNYDEASDHAEDANDMLEQPDEKMLLLILQSYLDYEDHKEIRRVLRTMEKLYPGSPRTIIAKAMVLMEDVKFKAAEKQLASLIPCDTEPDRLFALYLDAAEFCGKSGLVRKAFLTQLAYMKDHSLKYEIDRYFAVYAPIMMAINDIRRKNEKCLRGDLDTLKRSLASKQLNRMEESRLAYWITEFCTEAMESGYSWAYDAFISFIRWCDENDVFVTENALIESAYGSYESYKAYNSPDSDKELYDLVAGLHGEGEMEDAADLAERYWYAAEKLRRDPQALDRFVAEYPHFAGNLIEQLTAIAKDPEKAKRDAEQFLADFHDVDPMDIRTELNRSIGKYKHDDDRKRFS